MPLRFEQKIYYSFNGSPIFRSIEDMRKYSTHTNMIAELKRHGDMKTAAENTSLRMKNFDENWVPVEIKDVDHLPPHGRVIDSILEMTYEDAIAEYNKTKSTVKKQ